MLIMVHTIYCIPEHGLRLLGPAAIDRRSGDHPARPDPDGHQRLLVIRHHRGILPGFLDQANHVRNLPGRDKRILERV